MFRSSLHLLLLLAMMVDTSVAGSGVFDFSELKSRAKDLAAADYKNPEELAQTLRKLTYDQYRAIRPAPESALWKSEDLPFRLEFFHPGYLFGRPVKMNLINEKGLVSPLPIDPKRFDFSKLVLDDQEPPVPSRITGYAGFRILHPLHPGEGGGFDEIGSFIGASYFRLLGKDQRYGISARGLALNVINDKLPEEFPDFVEFWILKPRKDAKALEFFALLDSPSVTGAYRFQIRPGISTDTHIDVALFFREKVPSVGLAPLTSMFWFGENSAENHFPDWRPEVHDSDGLLLRTRNEERVWRPLFNDSGIRFSQFNAPDPLGFGLMQRDRDFHHYEDLGNPYHLTPTAWISPEGKWGEGAVRLIELPTGNESIDNVVAFFELKNPPASGESLEYSYTLSMKMRDEIDLSPDRVVATRVGLDPTFADTRRFVIDFDGPGLRKIPADGPIFAEINSSANGYVTENQCYKNVMTGGWRVEFKLDTDEANIDPVELRCLLKNPNTNEILSETWSYQWSP